MTILEKNLRFYAGTMLGNSLTFFFLNKYRNGGNILSTQTELCVEGFQRSGNSYFINFFKMVNTDVKVAHHYHSGAQIVKAVQQNVPTVLLIREPKDAIASLITWDKRLTIGVAISCYIQFYKRVLPVKKNCLVIQFSTLIKGIDPVILNINQHFGTSFSTTNFSKEHHAELLKKGELKHKDLRTSPYPNKLKSRQNKDNQLKIIQHSAYQKALNLFNKF